MASTAQQQPALVQLTEPDTEAWVGSECLGTGLLNINETCLTWSGPERQFALPYSTIYAHALAKTGSGCASGRPHLLLMALVDGSDSPEEVRLCPQSADRLQAMFDAVSHCQTMLASSDNGDDFYGEDLNGEEDNEDEEEGPDFDHLLVGGGGGNGDSADQPMDTDQFEDAQ